MERRALEMKNFLCYLGGIQFSYFLPCGWHISNKERVSNAILNDLVQLTFRQFIQSYLVSNTGRTVSKNTVSYANFTKRHPSIPISIRWQNSIARLDTLICLPASSQQPTTPSSGLLILS